MACIRWRLHIWGDPYGPCFIGEVICTFSQILHIFWEIVSTWALELSFNGVWENGVMVSSNHRPRDFIVHVWHGSDGKVCKHSRESLGREIACLLSKTKNDGAKFHKLNAFSEKKYENGAKLRRWQYHGKQKYTLVSGYEGYMGRSTLFRLYTRNEPLELSLCWK